MATTASNWPSRARPISVSAGSGPVEIESLGQPALDGRANDRAFFVAEQAFFAGVRIQGADADARPRAFELGHDARHEPRFAQDRLARQRGEHVGQRHVQRHVDDRQTGRPAHVGAGTQVEHHGEVVDAAQFGQQLGVARILVAGAPQGRLVQRRGRQPVDLAGQRQRAAATTSAS